jgi:hypothetical protein
MWVRNMSYSTGKYAWAIFLLGDRIIPKGLWPHTRRISPSDLFLRSYTIVSGYGNNLRELKTNISDITAHTSPMKMYREILLAVKMSFRKRPHCACQVRQNGPSPLTMGFNLISLYILLSRSQWRRSLRHEMSSFTRTLGLWVRIPLAAWIFVCLYSLFACR